MTLLSALVTCEHASFALPDGVELGVGPEVIASHIGYDRGAREVAIALAERLEAPLHLGVFTRLWVDLNRRAKNPDVIVAHSSGVRIANNAGLSDAARAARIERDHRPYRERVRRDALAAAARGTCFHLSIHSFDPDLDRPGRAFDCGVLFDPRREPERTLAHALAGALRGRGRDVRLNEPYKGFPEGVTSWLRAQISEARYVGLEIESSYDALAGPRGPERMADDLAQALAEIRRAR